MEKKRKAVSEADDEADDEDDDEDDETDEEDDECEDIKVTAIKKIGKGFTIVYDTKIKSGLQMALVSFFDAYTDYVYPKKMIKIIEKYYNSISDGASKKVFYRILRNQNILKK